jgi:hypothetical protein
MRNPLKTLRLWSLIATMLMILSGCQEETPQPPKDLIAEDTYINLLAEFQLAEAFRNNYDAPNEAQRLVDSTLRVYRIDYDQFLRSHRYYQRNLEAQKERYDQAIERLTQTLKQNQERLQNTSSSESD